MTVFNMVLIILGASHFVTIKIIRKSNYLLQIQFNTNNRLSTMIELVND